MAVDRHPWTYRGAPESGGRLAPREPATERHPTHRGRLYVVGYGWLWLSGWQQLDGSIRLAASTMSSDDVDRYCLPADGSARNAPGNQAQVSHASLVTPQQRAELVAGASPSRAAPAAHALEHAPAGGPGGPSGTPAESRNSHTPIPSDRADSENGRPDGKTVTGEEVARGGRRMTQREAREDVTEEGYRELNDEIPF